MRATPNAYTYWWITYGNGLATSSGTIFKRAYVLGQFAKYIRPGYSRVDATANPVTNVSVSAYKGDGKVVIVAVNTGTASVNQNFVMGSGTGSSMSSWQTTASSNMAAGQTYQVSGGSFTAALPGQSITTFVGTLSGVVASDGGAADVVSGTGGRDAAGTSAGGSTGAGGGTGGVSGNGGASASETGGSLNSGGRVGSGGRLGSGGAAGESGGTTTANAGGAATGGSSAGGAVGGSGSGGSATGGTTTAGGKSSGCSCALAGRNVGADARSLAGGIGALLALCGLAFARRRISAR